ncbi:aldo/keto reductase [Calothrix sp. PCC 6303]|uniref:aldo/keto reductase n=1 Tax=Calothrix sp. PCC 6303 TaxID=1170562 RepID=UPI0002A02860|nr:aldo/keto reductase [Calothrix sp. PCC 6303]AFY99342.1 NADP-dependent oxidoreductase domain protein [Calothrix sp. PCC 6303]
MQTKQLGNSDLYITPIGFGAWAIGGSGWSHGWGSQDDTESINAIRRAIDLGINWIDTAAIYGLGHSEEVVAHALKGVSDRPYIFSKCSQVLNNKGEVSTVLKADSLRREVEESLQRLQTDVIDLYQIHWPNADIDEGWTTLTELQKQGKIRYIGVSNFNVEQMRRIQQIAPITSLQPPYSLLDRDVEQEILPFCQQEKIGIINYSPMASGMLTGAMTRERVKNLPDDDWRRRSPKFQEPNLSRNLNLVELLRQIGELYGRSPGEVAIAWTLRHPAVTGAIVGGRNAKQVEGIIGAGEFRLSDDEIKEIETFLSTLFYQVSV